MSAKLTQRQIDVIKAMQIGHEIREWGRTTGKPQYDGRINGKWRGITPQAKALIRAGLAKPHETRLCLVLTEAGQAWAD